MGGAAEGAGSGAVVRRFQGGPGSHEVTETLLQVSWESWGGGGHLVMVLCCRLEVRCWFGLCQFVENKFSKEKKKRFNNPGLTFSFKFLIRDGFHESYFVVFLIFYCVVAVMRHVPVASW